MNWSRKRLVLIAAAAAAASFVGVGLVSAAAPSDGSVRVPGVDDVVVISQSKLDHRLEQARATADRVGDEFQRSALADGQVTQAEYTQAVSSLLNCLAESGFAVDNVNVDWSGRLYNYVVTGPADGEKQYLECYDRTAGGVDMAYQTSVENELARLAASAGACLLERGMDVDKVVDPTGKWQHPAVMQMGSGAVLWDRCAAEAVRSSSGPSLPSWTFED